MAFHTILVPNNAASRLNIVLEKIIRNGIHSFLLFQDVVCNKSSFTLNEDAMEANSAVFNREE